MRQDFTAIKTLAEVLLYVRLALSDHGVKNADQESRWILEEVLKVNHVYLRIHSDKLLREDERAAVLNILSRRLNDEPLAHILGKQNFLGLDFKVDRRVLIPRHDTEVLVETTITKLSQKKLEKPLRILDLGCGSGCIAISLKKALPHCHMTAWDLSLEALTLAKENAESLLGSDHGIEFKVKNGLNPKSWDGESFDVVVSNPPYIAEQDRHLLARSVVAYEPALALFAGKDGLDFYRPFIALLPQILRHSEMRVFLEVGVFQADKIKELLTHWRFQEIEVYQDYAGIDRVVAFKVPF